MRIRIPISFFGLSDKNKSENAGLKFSTCLLAFYLAGTGVRGRLTCLCRRETIFLSSGLYHHYILALPLELDLLFNT
jgi:hypothetical protein|uniref:ORF76 n=1 Tax=Oryza sativa subsp. japonica TaxID=39947 RepID=Q35308_ORYSJ|nr:ORF76 [Oryza sativa Japonica Group]